MDHSHKGVPLSNEKERLTTCNNMDKSLHYNVEWKKPDKQVSRLKVPSQWKTLTIEKSRCGVHWNSVLSTLLFLLQIWTAPKFRSLFKYESYCMIPLMSKTDKIHPKLLEFRKMLTLEGISLGRVLGWYLFKKIIYFWLCWVFIAVYRLSLFAASRGYSLVAVCGFLLWWFPLLQSTGCMASGLQ